MAKQGYWSDDPQIRNIQRMRHSYKRRAPTEHNKYVLSVVEEALERIEKGHPVKDVKSWALYAKGVKLK